MKKYVDLNDYGIGFKNLLSAPAPIGRMLNYIIQTGDGILKHKPGNRNLNMENNIGSAWAIEFMIGLGILKIGDLMPGTANIYDLSLTNLSFSIYNLLKANNCTASFNEDSNPKYVLEELDNSNLNDIKGLIEKIFRKSAVFENLKIYLDIENNSEKHFVRQNANDFKNDFFGTMKEIYENKEYKINPESDYATTGENRVPSLIQLCEFLNYVILKDGDYVFSIGAFRNGIYDIPDVSDPAPGVDDFEDDDNVEEQVQNEDINTKIIQPYSDEELNNLEEQPYQYTSQKKGATSEREKTDPRKKATRLKRANYLCEVNPDHKTFLNSIGKHQYLECHHIIPISAQKDFPNIKLDSLHNLIAICPICHSQIHYGDSEAKLDVFNKMYNIRMEELNKKGFNYEQIVKIFNKYYKK